VAAAEQQRFALGAEAYPPGGVFLRVEREAVLALAAPSVALLQIAHPLIAAAFGAHTDRARDPMTRLRATRVTNLTVIFGSQADATAAVAKVAHIHERTRGSITQAVGRFPPGTPYSASDPELLLWGYATILDLSLRAYANLVGPLGPREREAFVVEAQPFGLAFGIPTELLPGSVADLESLVGRVLAGGDLIVGPDARALANEVLRPVVPLAYRPALPVVRLLTAGLLPVSIRAAFGIPWSPRHNTLFRVLTAGIRAAVKLTPGRLRYAPEYRRGGGRGFSTLGTPGSG
jgi:uncharacterized protein (DUF2236 family)